MTKLRVSVLNMVQAGLMAAMMTAMQVAMAGLPNIELVSFLILVFTLFYPGQTRAAIAGFVLLEGLIFGFNLWWISYLYIWYLLHFVVLAFKKQNSALFFALLSGSFGLLFGSLTAIPTLFMLGPAAALAYIASGLYFDFMHCVANIFLCLALYRPAVRALSALKSKEQKAKEQGMR